MGTTNKPTLLQLRRRTQITSEFLAREAGVTLGQSYEVEIGGFVPEPVARQVLAAFSRLTHMNYTLDDIQWQRPSKLYSEPRRVS